MKFSHLKFIVPLISLLITACGNAATSTQATPVQQSDLRDKPIDSITDDDLYAAVDLLKNPDRSEKEFKQAFYVLNKLAQRGNDGAEYALGIWYEDKRNPNQDINQAISWYTKAAEHGVKGAQNDLGLLFSGIGDSDFPQDIEKAEYWLLKSANNSESQSTNAMLNLGIMYYHKVYPPNYAKSLLWFDKAAQLGDPLAVLSYIQIQTKRLVPDVNYELAYYRACLLKRYQTENPLGWAALVKRQPEAEKILDVSGAFLERGLKEQDITRIQRQAISVDLSNELK